jgi:cell division protease FtsH
MVNDLEITLTAEPMVTKLLKEHFLKERSVGILEKIKAAFKRIPPKKMYYAACIICGCFMLTGLFNLQAMLFPAPPVDPKDQAETVNYSKFMSLIKDKKLEKATVESDKIEATGKDGKRVVFYHGRILTDTSLPKELNAAGIEVSFPEEAKGSVLDIVFVVIQVLLPIVFMLFFLATGSLLFTQFKGKFSDSWMRVVKNTKVNFDDVAGHKEAKEEVQEIVQFLQTPEVFRVTGARVPRGALLVGPAGNGKTLLAEAIAGQAGVNFIECKGSGFSNMFVGTGRDRVEKLFKKARKLAPCIVFIDEFDSVARKRGASNTDVGREQDTTLNQLLTEMDGFGNREGVVVLAATNFLELLDLAAIRSGRFDRHIHVGLPDIAAREAILKVHTKKLPLADGVDLSVVARGTPGYSGADLQNIANEAAFFASRRNSRTVNQADFEAARDKIMMGPERKSPLNEHERRLTAYHEAGHAVTICLSSVADPIHKATILPRGRALGLVMQLPEDDRHSITRAQLMARLDILMAGRAAEEIIFGDDNITSGAMSDIEEATKTATNMVVAWGMSKAVGMRRVEASGVGFGDVADAEIRRLINEAYDRAKEKLKANMDSLEAVAQALLDKETLDGAEIRRLVKTTATSLAA